MSIESSSKIMIHPSCFHYFLKQFSFEIVLTSSYVLIVFVSTYKLSFWCGEDNKIQNLTKNCKNNSSVFNCFFQKINTEIEQIHLRDTAVVSSATILRNLLVMLN